jgi:hypothetical protein
MANDDIQGTVTDANGNAVGGAIVALWYQGSPNKVVTTQADSNGNYIFTQHPDADGTSRNWHVAARDPTDKTRQFPSLHSVSSQLSPAIPGSGVALYNFEQDVTDPWGNNDGTNNGVPFVTTAQVGDYAADFDGTDDYVDNTGFGIGGTGASIAFWAKPRTVSYSGIARVVFWGDGSPQFEIHLDDGKWDALYFNGSNPVGNVKSSATSGTYIHAAYVWRDQQEAELYIDGSSVGTTSHSSSASFSGIKNRIGFHGDGTGNHYDGLLDDLRYYNKGLSDTEVSNLYNTGTISI